MVNDYLKWYLSAAVSSNVVVPDHYNSTYGFSFSPRLLFYGFDAGTGGGCDMLRAMLDNSGFGIEIDMAHAQGVTYV